jgi:hypothetical protein
MGTVILAVILVPWLIAMWAMITMIVAALNDRNQLSLGSFLSGSFVLADYNRKRFRTFVVCILIDIGLVILVNVLWLSGWLTL